MSERSENMRMSRLADAAFALGLYVGGEDNNIWLYNDDGRNFAFGSPSSPVTIEECENYVDSR